MSGQTAIAWATHVWNPVTGCTRVSKGCDHCYAFALHDQRYLAWKRGDMPAAAPQYHQPFSRVQLLEQRLTDPLRWRAPRRIFVNSMSDLFHEDVPDEFIAQVFAVMALASRHTFQVLTKRPERMAAWVAAAGCGVNLAEAALTMELPRAVREDVHCRGITTSWPLPNVHLGVSIEDQPSADARIPHLLRTPAAVRFLSCEPLLGPVDLRRWLVKPVFGWPAGYGPGTDRGAWEEDIIVIRLDPCGHIQWVIAGGESGPHARPMHPDWARSLRDQCAEAGVPFLFKQVGGRTPKAGGRLLDGVEHHEFPQVRA